MKIETLYFYVRTGIKILQIILFNPFINICWTPLFHIKRLSLKCQENPSLCLVMVQKEDKQKIKICIGDWKWIKPCLFSITYCWQLNKIYTRLKIKKIYIKSTSSDKQHVLKSYIGGYKHTHLLFLIFLFPRNFLFVFRWWNFYLGITWIAVKDLCNKNLNKPLIIYNWVLISFLQITLKQQHLYIYIIPNHYLMFFFYSYTERYNMACQR